VSEIERNGELIDPVALIESVRRALFCGKYSGVRVGLIYGDHIFSGSGADEADTSRRTNESGIKLGCIAKLFTFALMRRAMCDGIIRAESTLTEMLGGEWCAHGAPGIMVRHLFNHIHGLDDSRIAGAPLRADGCIDLHALRCALYSSAPIAPPGRFYSYGSGGALLAAAILERQYDMTFSDVLTKYCLAPLGVASSVISGLGGQRIAHSACAATGAGLVLSMGSLLQFLVDQMLHLSSDGTNADGRTNLKDIIALPGWHSVEKGIYFGWKYYGDDWFGHNSEVPEAGMFLRLNLRLRVGIIVASRRYPPTAVASALFRRYWPSVVRLEMPKLKSDPYVDRGRASCYEGMYANGERAYGVTADSTGKLFLRSYSSGHSGEDVIAPMLHPAEAEIFFMRPPVPKLPSFVQFIRPGLGGFSYLWTGSRVVPRVEPETRMDKT
jgi:CubicO group peptidase (beta-lactamase class C family)